MATDLVIVDLSAVWSPNRIAWNEETWVSPDLAVLVLEFESDRVSHRCAVRFLRNNNELKISKRLPGDDSRCSDATFGGENSAVLEETLRVTHTIRAFEYAEHNCMGRIGMEHTTLSRDVNDILWIRAFRCHRDAGIAPP